MIDPTDPQLLCEAIAALLMGIVVGCIAALTLYHCIIAPLIRRRTNRPPQR